MKLFKKMLLVCSFFVFHQNIYCGVDSSDLERIAGAYGYKTANLQALNHFITENAADGITIPSFFEGDEVKRFEIAVPEFRGISSGEVKAFLKDNDLDVDARWNELVETHVWTQEDKPEKVAQIWRNKKLPTAFLAAIKVLAGQIKAKLKENVFVFNQGALDFIAQAESDEKKLVVRSTGKEDTDEMANAGGNETVINVLPNAQKITEAMGDVAVSYISEKSLTQRLAVAKTAAQVEEILSAPFMPVLVQIMIGEKVDGEEIATDDDIKKVPVSGVMFTTEADGRTPGVMHVDMTFGQGEGVVNSLVAVDTFYVGDSTFGNDYRIVHSIIREKKQRMVPLSQGGLKALPNTREMEKSLCVDEKTVLCLKELAVKIEEYYGKPMDVEFVVEPAKKIIYLVQARPIVFESNRSLSYLNLSDEVKGQIGTGNILNGVTTGMGDGGVKVITSADQIMLETTLLSALGKYMAKNGEERKKIKCVLTKEAAAALSHEATTFRAENMSVLQLDDVDSLSGWIAAGEFPILVDVQREVAIKWHDSNLKNLEQLRGVSGSTSSDIAAGASEAVDRRSVTNGILKDGWFTSPIPQQESLIDKRFEPLEQELQALFAALRPVRKKDGVDLRILIEELKNSKAEDKPEVLKIVKKILRRLFDQVKKQDSSPGKKEAKRLVKYAAMSVIEILKAIESAENPRDLRVLYAINFLEAILFQQPSRTVVGGYSYLKLLKTTGEENVAQKVAVVGFESLKDLKTQLLRSKRQSFSDEVGSEWSSFVNGLESEADDEQEAKAKLEKLAWILKEVAALDILTAWINVFFVSAWDKTSKNATDTLSSLESEYEGSQEFLKVLQEKKKLLDSFDINKFENPDEFEKQWKLFVSKIVEYFKSGDFLNIFNSGESLVRLDKFAAVQTMKTLVDVFDSSIKMMKGSTSYSLEVKISNFNKMLVQYFALLESLVNITVLENLGGGEIVRKKDIAIEPVRKRLAVAPESTEAQLLQSLNFDVRQAAIGIPGDFERYQPKTREDIFTFIHQSLVSVVGSLVSGYAAVINLPEWVLQYKMENWPRQYLSLMSENGNKPVSFKLSGISIDDSLVKYTYNIPLRTHAFQYILEYKYAKKKLLASVVLYGDNEFGRWDRTVDLAKLLSSFTGIKLVENSVDKVDVVVTFSFDEMIESEQILFSLAKLAALSWSTGIDEEISETEEDIVKNTGKNSLKNLPGIEIAINKIVAKILDFSIDDDRIFWLLPAALNHVILYNKESFNDKVIRIVDKFLNDSNYRLKSQLFAFKRIEDPRKNKIYYEINDNTYLEKVSFDKQVDNLLYFILPLSRMNGGVLRKIKEFADSSDNKSIWKIASMILLKDKEGVSEESLMSNINSSLNSDDILDQKYALIMAKKFYEKRMISEEFLISSASKGFEKDDPDVRGIALDIFITLVKNFKRGAFYKSAQVAEIAAGLDNVELRLKSLDLFQALVKANKAFRKATNVAKIAASSNNVELQSKALDVFQDLVFKRRANIQVIEALKAVEGSNNVELRLKALENFQFLVIDHNFAYYDDAVHAAQSAESSNNISVHLKALDIFYYLVYREYAYAQAADAAERAADSNNINLKSKALYIFQALVEKGKSYDKATEVAERAAGSSNIKLRKRALAIIRIIKFLDEESEDEDGY